MEDLRSHPNFDPLPLASTLAPQCIQTLEDVRQFRQDSWQWYALQAGRCTTSKAAGALGFLEPQAGRALGISKMWLHGSRGGITSYYRMSETALRTLSDMQSLCEIDSDQYNTDTTTGSTERSVLWRPSSSGDNGNTSKSSRGGRRRRGGGRHVAADYSGVITKKARAKRKEEFTQIPPHHRFSAATLSWGKAQEATAILTALNYFHRQDPGVKVKEVGLCGAGLEYHQDNTDTSLLIGAAPDGLLEYSDGTLEALEVKNHSPFHSNTGLRQQQQQSNNSTASTGTTTKAFQIRIYEWRKPWLQSVYIPQVMLEMLCVGPSCRSTVLVRQTALKGAAIVRVHRDDAWLEEMVFWLQRFQTEFVQAQVPPGSDFFWNDPDPNVSARYREFVEQTKVLQRNCVELVDIVPHEDIQRGNWEDQRASLLFLD